MFTKQQKTILAVLSVLAAVLLAAAVFAVVRHAVKTDPSASQEPESTQEAAEASPDTDPAETPTDGDTAASEAAASTTASAPQTTDAPAADTAKIVTPTEKELKEVADGNGFLRMLGSVTVDFDCTKLNTASVKRCLFFLNYSEIYISHYGNPQSAGADLENDGKERMYWVYPEENIIWLARNVLNYTGAFDRSAFEAGGNGGNPARRRRASTYL